ncbi:MAG TPA: MoxR family ATPase, partial [Micromonosporaceae bacterium]|nr:MoxR family ATPase [Micromonosporaceae bacterium]
MLASATTALAQVVLDEIEQAVVGKRDQLRLILLGLMARGHVLIEDLPGVGKTLIARSFAAALGLRCTRIQFTPDLLPADLIGATVYEQSKKVFNFRPGPVFTNLLLADEINRTPPRTQAALLEAMAEGQVSVDGNTHRLPDPFFVLATDNPIEHEGTYPLPEAQLDRFALRVRLGYLSRPGALEMLRRRLDRGSTPLELRPVVGPDEVLAMRESLESVTVPNEILEYVVELAAASREHAQVEVGVSPRAELDLVQLTRARAVLCGRDYVTVDDVRMLARPAWAHRISLAPELWVRR